MAGLKRQLIKHADKKFPDTNFLPSYITELTGEQRPQSDVFMVSQFYTGRQQGQRSPMGSPFRAGDAGTVNSGQVDSGVPHGDRSY
jgi:hypothetical protein